MSGPRRELHTAACVGVAVAFIIAAVLTLAHLIREAFR